MPMMLIEGLGLEPRHIDVGRALAFARLAFETQIERPPSRRWVVLIPFMPSFGFR